MYPLFLDDKVDVSCIHTLNDELNLITQGHAPLNVLHEYSFVYLLKSLVMYVRMCE